MGDSLKSDRDVTMALFKHLGLESMAAEGSSSTEIWRQAVRDTAGFFSWCPESLRGQKELALKAVARHGHLIRYVAGSLKEDPEVLSVAFSQMKLERIHERMTCREIWSQVALQRWGDGDPAEWIGDWGPRQALHDWGLLQKLREAKAEKLMGDEDLARRATLAVNSTAASHVLQLAPRAK